jgi:hypothetical protein
METKPALKTTEFIVTVATLVCVLGAALGEALPPKYAAIAGSIATGAYAVARGLAKLNIAPGEALEDSYAKVKDQQAKRGTN